MKILFLTTNSNTKPLIEWLKDVAKEEVILWEDIITSEDLNKLRPDFIISYNYKYILKKDILDFLPNRIINLHISLLPYNKGSHPNIWSFLEDTPKGVTIHYVDEGLDTGDIIVQKELFIDEDKETLKSSYEILHREIQTLFKEYWDRIKNNAIFRRPQVQTGTFHPKKDFEQLQHFIAEKGWKTSIRELKEKYNQYKHRIIIKD